MDELGWFYNLNNENWYHYMQQIDLLSIHQDTTKINMWIPRLVELLKQKAHLLESQSSDTGKTKDDAS